MLEAPIVVTREEELSLLSSAPPLPPVAPSPAVAAIQPPAAPFQAVPPPVAAAPLPPSPPATTPPPAGGHSSKRYLMTIAFGVFMSLTLIGGVAYAYVKQIGPFSVSQYSEDSFLSSILKKSAEIETASYKFSAALALAPRDKDAVPLVIDPPSEEKRAQYDHDVRRVSDARTIISSLSYGYGEQRDYDSATKKYITKPGKPYPASLSLMPQTGYGRGSIKDPITSRPYEYRVTEGGQNFALTVDLETPDAVSAIRKSYGYVATSTLISGQRVTFTKRSGYVYISSEIPQPLLVSMSDSLRAIPPDVSGSFSLGATTDLSKGSVPDWRFNATAVGDMGDLTYKFDVEARKKDTNYYVRINNIPSIIPYLGSYKGKWIEIVPKAAATSTDDDYYRSYNPFEDVASTIADSEERYKTERAEFAKELRGLAELADQEGLIVFKTSPIREEVEGRDLYRYELTIRKEAIIPFYTKVLAEADKYKKLNLARDNGLLEYLKSNEFEKIFDYVNKNTALTMWTDTAGYPAKIEYRLRVVPPETAVQLKDKQIGLVFSLDLSEINEPVQIEKPADAKPIDQIISEIEGNVGSSLSDARQKNAEASVKANLSSVRVAAELYYDAAGKGSYGTQSWVTGAASKCNAGMFKDPSIAKNITSIYKENADAGGVACYANGKNYLVGAALTKKEWWCIDSSGTSILEFGALPTKLPTGGECP